MPTIQYRRGTSEQWQLVNPVLNPGEPGYETDSGLQKVGDGSTNWTDLPYFVDEPGAREMINDALSTSRVVTSPQVASIRVLTQTDFDALTPSSDVLYVVVDQ